MKTMAILFPMFGMWSADHSPTLAAAKQVLLAANEQSAPASDELGPSITASKGIAASYCEAKPNSFGMTATIEYTGSLVLDDGTFGLLAHGCPPIPQSFGMFTYGPDQANVPFANGTLCILPIGMKRFAPQPIGNDGSVALSMLTGPEAFAPFGHGTSWNFQLWYRNPAATSKGGATINFSNGLHVEFAP